MADAGAQHNLILITEPKGLISSSTKTLRFPAISCLKFAISPWRCSARLGVVPIPRDLVRGGSRSYVQRMRFGIIDHNDDTGRPHVRQVAERLELIEAYDLWVPKTYTTR
jgi:hypothetical protein